MKNECVYLYVDEGASPPAVRQAYRALRRDLSSAYTIEKIDAKALLHTPWQEKAALLTIPGGRDVPYHEKLQGLGTAKIRAFVENGGKYLGLCAGAYFGCQSIRFAEGRDLAVLADRELAFFPGVAQGPAYGSEAFAYMSEAGAEAAPIAWEGDAIGSDPLYVYYNGGCAFHDDTTSPHVEVCARYTDLPQSPPAIVLCPVGKGMALLSGVHPEYSPEFLNMQDARLADIGHRLRQSDSIRRRVFREMLSKLGLTLQDGAS